MNPFLNFVTSGLLGLTLQLAALPAAAQSDAEDCAAARDPSRCEARQAAIAACADKHGPYKRACLEAAMPPVDCEKSKNPKKCEAAQKAKTACLSKADQEKSDCLRDSHAKKKSVKSKSKSKNKVKAKKTSKKKAAKP